MYRHHCCARLTHCSWQQSPCEETDQRAAREGCSRERWEDRDHFLGRLPRQGEPHDEGGQRRNEPEQRARNCNVEHLLLVLRVGKKVRDRPEGLENRRWAGVN